MKEHKWVGPDGDVFHYCSELEHALGQYYGQERWYGTAGGFCNYRNVRKAVLAASRAIRARLRKVGTADDRLRLALANELQHLDQLAGRLSDKGESLLEMLGCLLEIIALLLGYDWQMGKPNRQLAYSQTPGQIRTDDQKTRGRGWRDEMAKEDSRLTQIIGTLFDEGFRIPQIAGMLNTSPARVKARLVRCGKLARDGKTYDRRT